MKLLVVSTAKNTNHILDQMKVQAGDQMEVVLHIGDDAAENEASHLSQASSSIDPMARAVNNSQYSAACAKLIASPEFFQYRDGLVGQLNRSAAPISYQTDPLQSQQDFHNYYHILVDSLSNDIVRSGATHCLFLGVPNKALGTAVYQLVKYLGLPMKIVAPSPFANRFISMSDLAEFGSFCEVPDAKPLAVEGMALANQSDLIARQTKRAEPAQVTASVYLRLTKFLLRKRPLSALNLVYVARALQNMKNTYGELPDWRNPFAGFFHDDQLAYFDHLTNGNGADVDLTGEFVYFPLQAQSEIVSSDLDDRFRDQAYAIERLSEMLPEGARILVHERPKQGACFSGPLFFHRIRRIPSVTVVPASTEPDALIAKAKFVATISGVAGWEAVSAGKPALVFGKAWYRKFSGVFEFANEPRFDDIANSVVDLGALDQSVGALFANAHEGVVGSSNEASDTDKNGQVVAAKILSLLNDTSQTSYMPAS